MSSTITVKCVACAGRGFSSRVVRVLTDRQPIRIPDTTTIKGESVLRSVPVPVTEKVRVLVPCATCDGAGNLEAEPADVG